MKFDMYSVRDELTGRFMNPLYMEQGEYSKPLAERQFKSQLNSIQLWRDNPSDYSLYLVGVFDDEAGAESVAIEKICSGRSVIDA